MVHSIPKTAGVTCPSRVKQSGASGIERRSIAVSDGYQMTLMDSQMSLGARSLSLNTGPPLGPTWHLVDCFAAPLPNRVLARGERRTKRVANTERCVVVPRLENRPGDQESPNGPAPIDRRRRLSCQHDTVGDVLGHSETFRAHRSN
jgi:hypothetical protein